MTLFEGNLNYWDGQPAPAIALNSFDHWDGVPVGLVLPTSWGGTWGG